MKLVFVTLICLQAIRSSSQAEVEPKIFETGIISTGEFESHPCFTPEGNTIYFVKSTPNFGFWTICVSKKQNGKWQKPEVAPFSGQYSDADPFITKDGMHFYFISNRPVDGKKKEDLDMDIWVMDKNDNEAFK